MAVSKETRPRYTTKGTVDTARVVITCDHPSSRGNPFVDNVMGDVLSCLHGMVLNKPPLTLNGEPPPLAQALGKADPAQVAQSLDRCPTLP